MFLRIMECWRRAANCLHRIDGKLHADAMEFLCDPIDQRHTATDQRPMRFSERCSSQSSTDLKSLLGGKRHIGQWQRSLDLELHWIKRWLDCILRCTASAKQWWRCWRWWK